MNNRFPKKSIEELADEFRQEGPRRFSNWSQEAFESYVEGPLSNLKRYLESQDKKQQDHASILNYLRLVYEGVGAGWLRTISWETPSSTFLAHCLARLVPNQLGNVAVAKRADVLRDVWNLGEGMAQEPQWLNQYAITQTNWSTKISRLQEHLEAILEPVLSQPENADWTGAYNVNVIHLREVSEGFLPGRMFLASPAVLCIENEFNNEETIGILLRRHQESEILGPIGKLPEHVESFTPPLIKLTPNAIVIGGTSVPTPLISSPRSSICAAIGVVAVSAEDSQRVWMVKVK